MSRRRGAFKRTPENGPDATKVTDTDANERIMAEFRLGQDKQLPGEPEEASRLIKGF